MMVYHNYNLYIRKNKEVKKYYNQFLNNIKINIKYNINKIFNLTYKNKNVILFLKTMKVMI